MRQYTYTTGDYKIAEFEIKEADIAFFGNLLFYKDLPQRFRIGFLMNKRNDYQDYIIECMNKDFNINITKIEITKQESSGKMGTPSHGCIYYNIGTLYGSIVSFQ